MSDIVSSWSPGQAMLPPDPDGHNRMLDRVAAEHLRAVAPGLAPCLSCQAGLCAEHGPVRVETTTSGLTCRNCGGAGRYEGVTDPRDGTVEWLACPCTAPAPPQPEPAKANAPRKGSKAWAIQEACRIVGIAFHGIAEYDEACDCFCSESPHEDYRNGGHALAFVEAAVREKLAREKAPAPPSEAKGEQPCACAGHREPGDPLICRKRYSEMLEAIYEDDYGDTAELRDALLRHDRALRERAREAEERAERYAALVVELRRERDEAREQRDAAQGLLSEALCNLGTARGDLATERAARLRAEAERDGALTEANDLRLRVERLVEGAAKLTERAEEAEEELRLADFRVKSAESRSDDFAARLAAAEAEERRVRALIGTRAGRTLSDAVADAMTSLREYHEGRLAEETGKLRAAEAEVKRLQKMVDGR